MATKLTAPLSVAATAAFLGLPAGGKSRDVAWLCGNAHGRINMWAAHKPMRYPSTLPLTDAQKRAANHGLTPPDGATAGMPVDDAWMLRVWTYGAPRGGAAEPYRLSDFDGYDTLSKAPVETPGTLRIGPLDTGTAALRFSFGSAYTSVVGTQNLTLHDFGYLADYYPCVVLRFRDRRGTEYVRCITGTATFGSGTLYEVSVPVSELKSFTADEFDYFMCGSSVRQTTLGVPLSGSYTVLPSARPLSDRIIISDTLPLRISFDRVRAGTVEGAALFGGRPVSEYSSLGTIVPTPGGTVTPDGGGTGGTDGYRYLNVGSKSTASFTVTVTNLGASSIRIPRTSLYCRVTNNLAGATTPRAPIAFLRRLNGSLMQPADAIELSAGASATYAVSWPEYCCVRNATGGIVSVGDTRRFNAGFNLYLGSANDATTLGSIGINISNYNA